MHNIRLALSQQRIVDTWGQSLFEWINPLESVWYLAVQICLSLLLFRKSCLISRQTFQMWTHDMQIGHLSYKTKIGGLGLWALVKVSPLKSGKIDWQTSKSCFLLLPLHSFWPAQFYHSPPPPIPVNILYLNYNPIASREWVTDAAILRAAFSEEFSNLSY